MHLTVATVAGTVEQAAGEAKKKEKNSSEPIRFFALVVLGDVAMANLKTP